jgi:hypothetical protein
MQKQRTGSVVWVVVALAAWSAAAVWFYSSRGWLLYYGDAEAHLNIARRMVDSQTPGYDQIGTVWLPLPHWLMLPFVRADEWWRSGLAGSISAAACFAMAGAFLFAAVRRAFACPAAAVAATALFALNPNLLYVQSTAMTEAVFFAALMALLYFSVRFRETQGWGAVAGAGLAACAGTLVRYEGWFLIPFAALYFLCAARRRRVGVALVFCALGALGPFYWLAHNWWLASDPLGFYRGPYSALAIQGNQPYPGKGDWPKAWLYFRTAAQLCSGPGLALMAMAGAAGSLAKRVFWPLALLALPGVFYIWSVHSSATPIFVPTLWPNSYYNARYGLAALPLLVVASAGLVAMVPPRWRAITAALVVAAGTVHWMVHPRPGNWVVWEESRVNSESRRAWIRETAEYLAPRYVRGSGIVTSFGDLTGIYRRMGIPLRETFTADNGLPWLAAMRRPGLYLWQEWAVAVRGDAVAEAVVRDGRYSLEKSIMVKGAPAIEIYRRTGGT